MRKHDNRQYSGRKACPDRIQIITQDDKHGTLAALFPITGPPPAFGLRRPTAFEPLSSTPAPVAIKTAGPILRVAPASLIHINVWSLDAVQNILLFQGEKMNKMAMGCLSEQHLLLFGAIIQWFARYELLVQEAISTILGAELAAVILLTRNLDFGGKRIVLLDLIRHSTIPLDRFDRVNEYLMVPHTLTPLWTDIVHSTWTPGVSTSWIQPDWILRPPAKVKALHDDPGAPSEKFAQRDQDKVAYTLNDLGEIVQALAANHERFSDYLDDVGLVPRRQTR